MKFCYTRKGQLEIGVTMMVLLVFFILLIVSLVFYFRFSYEGIKEKSEDILDREYSSLLNSIVNMPEFKCSMSGTDKECLDAVKLIAFRKVDQEYYNGVFSGVNKIEVEVVYPDEFGGISLNDECVVNSFNEFDKLETCKEFLVFNRKDEGMVYSMPIALYYPNLDSYRIGKLKIWTGI